VEIRMKAEKRKDEEVRKIKNKGGVLKGHRKFNMENGRIKRDLSLRTKEFALGIVRLYSQVGQETRSAGHWRSGLAIRNFRWNSLPRGKRAKSNPDFVTKLEGACKNLRKPSIGSNCSKRRIFAPEPSWSRDL